MHVMLSVEPEASQRAGGEVELSWTGADDRGLELEIVAVIATDVRTGTTILLVLHVMPTGLRGRD